MEEKDTPGRVRRGSVAQASAPTSGLARPAPAAAAAASTTTSTIPSSSSSSSSSYGHAGTTTRTAGESTSTTTTSAGPAGAGGGRTKKRPPKSSSSQFFTLLSQGASQVLLGRGGGAGGGSASTTRPQQHGDESRHLLLAHSDDAITTESSSPSSSGLHRTREHAHVGDDQADGHTTDDDDDDDDDDDENADDDVHEDGAAGEEMVEEEEEEEDESDASVPKAKTAKGGDEPIGGVRGLTRHERAQSQMGPVSAPATPGGTARRKVSKTKVHSEMQVKNAADEKERKREKNKRVVLVRKKRKSEEETYNPKYFFLREYGSSDDSTESEEEEEEEEESDEDAAAAAKAQEEDREKQYKGAQDVPADDHKSTHQSLPRHETSDLAKRHHKKKRKKNKHKRGQSGGWVMKKVLVLMGKKERMKGLISSNPMRKQSLPTTDGEDEDEMYEMMEIHSDEDVEKGETAEEKKAREDQAVTFLIELCRALHQYGAPVHRLEYNMRRVSESLNILASFAVMPSLILISIGSDNTRATETHIIRSSQGLNCAKLFWTDALIARLANNEIDLPDAIVELASINRRKSLYPSWLKLLMSGVCSASCASLFYGGGWIEIALSFGLGLLVGGLDLLTDYVEPLGMLQAALSSIICAFLTRLFITYVKPVCFMSVILAGIIWLLPGLSITVSIAELATRNMIAGTTRIFFAIIKALQLGFGMAVGTKLVVWTNEAAFIAARDSAECSGIGPLWTIPLFLCVSLSFNVLLDAHPRQWGIMTVSALLSFTIEKVIEYADYFSPETSSALSAFAVGVLGNVHARISGHPAIVSIIAGVLLLVPGSIGVKGVSALMENDVVSGIQFGFSMLTIALSICVGLLTANLVNIDKSYLGF